MIPVESRAHWAEPPGLADDCFPVLFEPSSFRTLDVEDVAYGVAVFVVSVEWGGSEPSGEPATSRENCAWESIRSCETSDQVPFQRTITMSTRKPGPPVRRPGSCLLDATHIFMLWTVGTKGPWRGDE